MSKLILGLLVPLFVLMTAACSSAPAGDVAVLVEIPRPNGLTNADVEAGFRKAAPVYENVPGLKRKYFTYTESHFGGVYLWESTQAADTFYNSEWQDRIQMTYGNSAELTLFDAPVLTEGGSVRGANADSVVTIVRVAAPWYAPRRTIVGRMKDAIPQYARVPGLDFKYFTIADGKKVGGIYLWEDTAAADAFYDDAWHRRIRETYGEDAEVMFLSSSTQVFSE